MGMVILTGTIAGFMNTYNVLIPEVSGKRFVRAFSFISILLSYPIPFVIVPMLSLMEATIDKGKGLDRLNVRRQELSDRIKK
jgi:hypothetical protein